LGEYLPFHSFTEIFQIFFEKSFDERNIYLTFEIGLVRHQFSLFLYMLFMFFVKEKKPTASIADEMYLPNIPNPTVISQTPPPSSGTPIILSPPPHPPPTSTGPVFTS
jgi:hypothetical protein